MHVKRLQGRLSDLGEQQRRPRQNRDAGPRSDAMGPGASRGPDSGLRMRKGMETFAGVRRGGNLRQGGGTKMQRSLKNTFLLLGACDYLDLL